MPFQNNTAIDITGQSFGLLTVIGRARLDKAGAARWLCQCSCGGSTITTTYRLRSGHSKSCGCLRKTINLSGGHHSSHRQTHTAEYKTWTRMKSRCNDPRSPQYPNYGGRGIRVCDPWMNSFEAFFFDMGLRPSSKHSIDRIDNGGNYEPGNCRWATLPEQGRNRRTNRVIEFNGEHKCLYDWASSRGMSPQVLHFRLRKGWSVERALTEKVAPRS